MIKIVWQAARPSTCAGMLPEGRVSSDRNPVLRFRSSEPSTSGSRKGFVMDHPGPPRGQRGGQRACRASPALFPPWTPLPRRPLEKESPGGKPIPPRAVKNASLRSARAWGPWGRRAAPRAPGPPFGSRPLQIAPRWPLPSVRGRDGPCGPPPAQIPPCAFSALGSCLGYERGTARSDTDDRCEHAGATGPRAVSCAAS